MDISSDEENCNSAEILQMAQTRTESLLHVKSKKAYESVYKSFMEWCDRNKTTSFSENVILAYFGDLSEKYKASSLWTQYSMLRNTLETYHKIKLDKYGKLRAFLKRKSDGYQAKKAKTFTPEQINSFIKNADDKKYLATKVALIMGIVGACRCNELKEMNIEDLQDLTSAILVNVPNTKTKVVRNFAITGTFYEIVKKYISLRPTDRRCSSFFLNYQKGKCTTQRIGINKFSAMGKQIARFLNLPDAELYTGHSFRISSTFLLVDGRGGITSVKRHGGVCRLQWQKATLMTL